MTRKSRSSRRAAPARAVSLVALALAGCASGPAKGSTPPSSAAAAPPAALEAPVEPVLSLRQRTLVATGLRNPRGMQPLADGALLVAEAGTGVPGDELSGRLVRLDDHNRDGDYLDGGELQVLLDRQPSKNIMNIVRRDEVFGLAGIAEGEGAILIALAFFGGPSTVFRIDGEQVVPWATAHGNLNDLAFDPRRRQWFATSSTSDELVRLRPNAGAERVLKIPPLENGQDPVPAYVRHDPISGELFVTLFTGSPEGEEGGLGVELVPRAGGIIAVDPERKRFRWVVRGLTVPTDLEIDQDGTIYVLEFCDAFLDPVARHEDLFGAASHGGFKRFSGRLLRIERGSGAVTVIARELDAPTNLALAGDALYVAQGMGTPGRPIPSPNGVIALNGFIERVALR